MSSDQTPELRNRLSKQPTAASPELDARSGEVEPKDFRRAAADAARRRQFVSQQAALAAPTMTAPSYERLVRAVYSGVLDYRATAPQQVAACLSVLRKVMSNVLQHPEEAKYRQIRMATRSFACVVLPVAGAADVLREAAWCVRIVNCEKLYCFDHQPGSVEWGLLDQAVKVLEEAASEVEQKVRRAEVEHDAAGRKKAENAQRNQVLAQIRGDKEERQARFSYSSRDPTA